MPKIVFQVGRLMLIPECGHMHEARSIDTVMSGHGNLQIGYTGLESERIEGTNNWRVVRYKGVPITPDRIRSDGTVDLAGL